MMQQEKKPFSKEEVLKVLEQLMGEMGAMDKLDMPDMEGKAHEDSESKKFESDEDMGKVTDAVDSGDSNPEKDPSGVDESPSVNKETSMPKVLPGAEDKMNTGVDEKDDSDMVSYLKYKMKGQMYK